jgi:hypothetical protein
LKNKIILSGLFLTTAISCSAYRPLVLTNAFLDPLSTTEVDYDDLNWSYALFNQYASGLSYTFRIDYSFIDPTKYSLLNTTIAFVNDGVFRWFNAWDTITGTYAEAELDTVWTRRLNQVFFDRDYGRVTKKANFNNIVALFRLAALEVVNFEVNIDSKISYRVNVGSVFMAFANTFSGSTPNEFYKYIQFYNSRDELLQTILLDRDISGIARNYQYNLSSILTNVNRFKLKHQWVDTPPYATSNVEITIAEFNLFTQNQEINIPDDVEGDVFGFEFTAVEWWDILGHLQNFAWWIVNKSPISPLFVWIDTYVITWVSGLITFITGVFRL